MSLALLPCEIYHREFDSKLLIAVELASKYNIPTLIGYDKYFNQLIPHLSSSVLLEKSCSSIVWQGRIKALKSRDGSVLVSDEEGFNNLTKYSKFGFSSRLDEHAAKHIDLYACWGSIDFAFWSNSKELRPKLQILGNPRSDLLGSLGRQLYKDDIFALNQMFGNFVLASDNLRVEHVDKNYVPPQFNMTDSELEKQASLREIYDSTFSTGIKRREHFASILEKSATSLPSQQFILRPHPSSDPRWWFDRFAQLRNLHVIYHKSVDPWILSSSCLLSTGCTTALQAAIADVPVIEVEDPAFDSDNPEYSCNSYLFTDLFVKTADELIDYIPRINQSPHNFSGTHKDLLSKCWHGSDNSLAYRKFANVLSSLVPLSDDSLNARVLNHARSHYKRHPLHINAFKWPPVLSSADLSQRFLLVNSLLTPSSDLLLQEVANNLYLISRK